MTNMKLDVACQIGQHTPAKLEKLNLKETRSPRDHESEFEQEHFSTSLKPRWFSVFFTFVMTVTLTLDIFIPKIMRNTLYNCEQSWLWSEPSRFDKTLL